MTLREAVHYIIFHTTRYVSPMAIATEWVLVFLGGVIVASAPFGSDRTLISARALFRRLANRKIVAILVCSFLPVLIRLAMLGFAPVPDPSIHDEFSHLLLADTLANGRLTNPPHPMWRHFESIHVIQQPTYNSMYPPGQGSVLALGQALFRDPWAGVVISVGLMCGTMCWMLQGWLPPAWALTGTLIAVLKIGIAGLYMNSYLGGPLAAAGGALLFGSAVRLKRKGFRAAYAFAGGVGLVLLMNTRPFEGAVLGLAMGLYLSPQFLRTFRRDRNQLLIQAVLPAAAVLLFGFAFTGYYCWRVTGSPLVLPYQINRNTYGWPENLAFLPPKKVEIEHKVLRKMHSKEMANRRAYESLASAIDSLDTRLFDNWTFLVGPALTIPLLFLPRIFRDRRTRPLVCFFGIVILLNLFQLVLYPYHLGPVVPVIFGIVAQGFRHMYVSLSRVSRLRGVYMAIAVPLCLVTVGAMKQQAVELGIPLAYWEYAQEPHRDSRARVDNWLNARPGKHLVIVRYSEDHNPDCEWVYNKADIDSSKVVWAREINESSDVNLLQYFSDRKAWLLEADVAPARVVRYQGQQSRPHGNEKCCFDAR
jgi:hypothetical protein